MSIYKQAVKKKFRFTTSKGELTVEDLFKLPLNSDKNPSLESVAQEIYKTLKSRTEVSFTSTAVNSAEYDELTVKLELVKDIIADRVAEAEAASNARKAAEQRQRLLALRDRKVNEKLEDMTLEEIDALLANS